MAEREGFEPSEGITPFAGLANLWFKPLTHLSCLFIIVIIQLITKLIKNLNIINIQKNNSYYLLKKVSNRCIEPYAVPKI